MTNKDAMKMALEALEVLGWQPTEEAMDYRDNAITALREALAEQPAPVAKPHEQEPVAYLVDGDLYYPREIDWETLQEQGHMVAALYTSPPAQRTWVGLTNKDVYECEPKTDWYDSVEFATAIEAKLRSKNEDRN